MKEAQTQLVRSEKLAAVGTLAAGMAHELNNPLAFALNNVALLERDTRSLLEILAVYREGRGALDAARPDLVSRLEAIEDACDLPYLTNHLVQLGQSARRGLDRVAQIVANLREFAQLDRGRITEVDLNTSIDQAVQLLGGHLARLNISHGIVAEHGGRIEVESVWEHGSLVRVRLPFRGICLS